MILFIRLTERPIFVHLWQCEQGRSISIYLTLAFVKKDYNWHNYIRLTLLILNVCN